VCARDGPANSAYEFPGTAGFASTSKGQLISMPAGAGAIYYKENAPTPDEGDGHHPQGAIVYDIAPSEKAIVYLALKPGANTITAVATDEAGLTSTQSVSVTYTPSPPPPALPHASVVKALSVGKVWVRFTIACEGAAGNCEIRSSLKTIEKLKGKKIAALAANKRKPKIRSKTVTVGSSKVVIAVGQSRTITIKLNSTGKKLLAKFKKLPARLTVSLLSAGKTTTIISRSVKLKPARKHKAKARAKSRKH
jgi:hypothetical protein